MTRVEQPHRRQPLGRRLVARHGRGVAGGQLPESAAAVHHPGYRGLPHQPRPRVRRRSPFADQFEVAGNAPHPVRRVPHQVTEHQRFRHQVGNVGRGTGYCVARPRAR